MITKTKILTLILFGLLFTNLYAQDDNFKEDPVVESNDDDRKFRFGIHFSPNISWLSPETTNYSSGGTSFGFDYGLSTEFFLSKNYLVSTGVSMSLLGGNVNYPGVYKDASDNYFSSDIKEEITLKYVNVPLTLKLRTNEIGYMTYYGNFGMKLGFNYKATSDIEYDHNGGISKSDVDVKSDMFFMNWWLVVGGGVEYNISGNTNVLLGFTFNNGFISPLNHEIHKLDATKNAIITSNEPEREDKKASANLSYFALNIGVFF